MRAAIIHAERTDGHRYAKRRFSPLYEAPSNSHGVTLAAETQSLSKAQYCTKATWLHNSAYRTECVLTETIVAYWGYYTATPCSEDEHHVISMTISGVKTEIGTGNMQSTAQFADCLNKLARWNTWDWLINVLIPLFWGATTQLGPRPPKCWEDFLSRN